MEKNVLGVREGRESKGQYSSKEGRRWKEQ
jgi:hypothetical protein